MLFSYIIKIKYYELSAIPKTIEFLKFIFLFYLKNIYIT